ncbi:Rgg/GadR/MutR family transcriptional regulator [Lactovum odontotermitis]
MAVNKRYGETFSRLCKAKEITMAEIERKTGIAKSTLSRFLNGKQSLTLDQIDKALAVIHMDLSEFDLYVNHFWHNDYEQYFGEINRAALVSDDVALKAIHDKAAQEGERMIALSAKARLKGLNEDEAQEINTFIMGIEIFTFYELAVLSDTISEFSPNMIRGTIRDLQENHKRLQERSRYRNIVCRIACRASTACVKYGQSAQLEAHESLSLAEKCCHERDICSRQIYRFTKGYYDLFFGHGPEHKQGREEMEKVIKVFEWEGSKQLAQYYQRIYDENVTNAKFPLYFKEWLK